MARVKKKKVSVHCNPSYLTIIKMYLRKIHNLLLLSQILTVLY